MHETEARYVLCPQLGAGAGDEMSKSDASDYITGLG